MLNLKIESWENVTNKKELVENVNILKDYRILFNEITFKVDFINYMNVFDEEIVEITQCDDSYCLNIYDYSTHDYLFCDVFFEELDELCQYLVELFGFDIE